VHHHAALGRVPYECTIFTALGVLVQIQSLNEQQFVHHGQNECQLSNTSLCTISSQDGREADLDVTHSPPLLLAHLHGGAIARERPPPLFGQTSTSTGCTSLGGSSGWPYRSARLRAPATRDANRLRLVGERSAKHAGEQDERVRERAGGRAVWRSTPPALVFVCTNGLQMISRNVPASYASEEHSAWAA
jgi:hypothetical protein